MENFDENIENIKNKLNNIKLDDEFKSKLDERLNEEYYKETTKKKKFYFPKQVVAACACLVVLSSCAFADQIDSFVDNLFSNKYQEFEDGVSLEELNKIDMEYIENNGVSIKIDYVMQKEDSLYLVFNVFTEKEFDRVYIGGFQILDENKEEIYKEQNNDFRYEFFGENKNNELIFLKINKLSKEYSNLNVIINKMAIKNENEIEEINQNWNFENIKIKEP